MQKRLYRSRKNRMIAGVCGGLAEYFDIDPVIMRVLFVVITLGGGFGIIGYILLWIIVPEAIIIIKSQSANTTDNEQKENSEHSEPEDINEKFDVISEEEYNKKHWGGKVVFSVIIILIGFMWLMHNIIPGIDFSHYWPLVLIAIGLLILLKSRK